MNRNPPTPERQPDEVDMAMTCADLDQLNFGDALAVFAAYGTPAERRVATRLLNDINTLTTPQN